MPDYLIFENWPVSLRLRELKSKSDKYKSSVASSKEKKDAEVTERLLSIMSIIDTLLDELEELNASSKTR